MHSSFYNDFYATFPAESFLSKHRHRKFLLHTVSDQFFLLLDFLILCYNFKHPLPPFSRISPFFRKEFFVTSSSDVTRRCSACKSQPVNRLPLFAFAFIKQRCRPYVFHFLILQFHWFSVFSRNCLKASFRCISCCVQIPVRFCVRLRRCIPVVFLSTDTIFAPQTAQFSCNPFAWISITRMPDCHAL